MDRKSNGFLLRSAAASALGGLLFGFDTAVISGTTRALAEQFSLSPAMLGFTVSSALWGTVLGSMFAAQPSDRYGRRGALGALAVLYVVSSLGCAFAWSLYALIFFRFIGGLAIGGSSVIGPLYIAEISPALRRGRMVGLFQVNVVLGILVAYFSNYVISHAGFGSAEWRWKLGVAALPAILFWIALLGIPQSPRWLVARGRADEARLILHKLGEPNAESEVRIIIDSLKRESAGKHERLFQSRYRRPVYLAISIGLFNQLSGINAILYYLNDIFERAGFTGLSSDMQAVAVGFTNFAFTIIAMSMIDRLGRKKLLLTGAAGTALCLAGITWLFATGQHPEWLLWLLAGFIAFFAFSQGAVIWVYLSEVFPNLVRAKGQSLGCSTHWIANALISGIFPVMAASSGSAPFAFFSLMTVIQFLVVLFTFPETSGVRLEEMERHVAA